VEKDGVRIVRCGSCSLVYNESRLLAGGQPQVYGQDYFTSSAHDVGYEDYLASAAPMHKTFDRRLKWIEQYIPAGKVLDAGCACGYFLDAARQRKWNAYGVDLSKWAVEQAASRHPGRVFEGPVENVIQMGLAPFDLITMWDLLEQVPDPAGLFRSAQILLREGGWIAFLMRDIDSLVSRITKERWIHLRPKEKYLYFSPKSLKPFLARMGFRLRSLSARGAGKDCSIQMLKEKLDYYSSPMAKGFGFIQKLLRLEQATVYVNLGDTKIVLAQKVSA
jgi:SAM-dependent methyltransferase